MESLLLLLNQNDGGWPGLVMMRRLLLMKSVKNILQKRGLF